MIKRAADAQTGEHCLPETCVCTFSAAAAMRFIRLVGVQKTASFQHPGGEIKVYQLNYKGRDIAFCMVRKGAGEAVACLERLAAIGSKRFLFFGSAEEGFGSFQGMLAANQAVRGEGVSDYYLPSEEEISLPQTETKRLCRIFQMLSFPYLCGKVFTTEAVYRISKHLWNNLVQVGCLAADTECAALAAACKALDLTMAQFFYYGEDKMTDGVFADACLTAAFEWAVNI